MLVDFMDPGILDTRLPLDPKKSGISTEERSRIAMNIIQSKLKNKQSHDAKRNTKHLELKVEIN